MIDPVVLPEMTCGPWTIKRVTVTKDEAKLNALRAGIKGSRRYVPPGTYTALIHDQRGTVMSDTPDEMRDHFEIVRWARGHVLINGLGLGMVLQAVLKKPEVSAVTVVEIDPSIIAMVYPQYQDPRLTVVQDDAFSYKPPKGVRYGAVWHDVWDSICRDNLPEMTKLRRRYGRRTDWQGCWAEDAHRCPRLR